MKGINDELNDKISREVMIKKAIVSAKDKVKIRRPITRRAIEDLEDMARMEKDWILE